VIYKMTKKNKPAQIVSVFNNVRKGLTKQPRQSKRDDLPVDMHLAKIKDGYMFRTNTPNKVHTYVVYTDTSSKEVRAVPTTHLYNVDEEKMEKVRKGLLRKVKFEGYETPSGVENYYYNLNVEGKPIDLRNQSIIVNKSSLPQSQARTIKNFANKARKV